MIKNLKFIINALEKSYYETEAPSVTLIANVKKNPFHVLVSTMISLRTKDEVTLKSSQRLFAVVNSFKEMRNIGIKELEQLIYPAGFYKTKAKRLKEIADIIITKYDGKIPDDMEKLLELPGVGRKTANLVLILGFNKPGICVDTHVHRISNRLGWVKTKTPDKTEFALRELLPTKYWRVLNDYLVSYGQTVCRPISPFCSTCRLNKICPKIDVGKSR
jgi:endonuclease-3